MFSKHKKSLWRWYNVSWTSTTLLQRRGNVVCLLGGGIDLNPNQYLKPFDIYVFLCNHTLSNLTTEVQINHFFVIVGYIQQNQ